MLSKFRGLQLNFGHSFFGAIFIQFHSFPWQQETLKKNKPLLSRSRVNREESVQIPIR